MNKSKPYSKYLLAFILFAITFVLSLELVLWNLGEVGYSYNNIVNLQNEKKIIGRKYSNIDVNYKIAGIKINKPEVIVLGTSRIMQIRDYFLPGFNLYNAGLPASSSDGLDGMNKIIKNLKHNPKLVVIGLDPWIFNSKYPPNRSRSKIKLFIEENSYLYWTKKFYTTVRDRLKIYSLFTSDLYNTLGILISDNIYSGIGLNAKIFNSGYRTDGSRQYPKGYQSEWIDKSVDDYKSSLGVDIFRFPSDGLMHDESLNKLSKLLDILNSKNIKPIGLLPPFSESFYSAIYDLETHSNFMEQYERRVCEVFFEKNLTCYNFSNLKRHNMDGIFYDQMHPTEKVMKQIFSKIIELEKI